MTDPDVDEEIAEMLGDPTPQSNSAAVAQNQLKSFVERVERLEEEKSALQIDIREVYSEAKGNGFDTKILRRVVALRKRTAEDRAEEEALLDLYKNALGMD